MKAFTTTSYPIALGVHARARGLFSSSSWQNFIAKLEQGEGLV